MKERLILTGPRLTLTNPLRNVEPDKGVPNATAAYTEVRHYGPAQTVAAASTDANPVSDHVRIAIDPDADQKQSGFLSQVRAVWAGDLSIAMVASGPSDPPDATTLVWLRLEPAVPLLGGLPNTLAQRGVARVPRCAFYGNVLYSSLADVLSDRSADELAPFLALGDTPGKLHVETGQNIGKLGTITLDDGTQGVALDFKLGGSLGGEPPISPHFFYFQIADFAGDLFSGAADADPDLSVWSVCEARHVIWLRDEWSRPFGAGRDAEAGWSAAAGVTGSVGQSFTASISPATAAGEAAIALDRSWAPENVDATATVTMSYTDSRGAQDLYLTPVPSDDQADTSLDLALSAPGESMLQALDPRDWFPAHGRRRDEGSATAVDVIVPAPHAPAPFSNGNVITPLVDGAAYFQDLDEALATVTAPDHWSLHAGWWLDAELTLHSSSLVDHWKRILGAEGRVFALAWNQGGGPLSAVEATLPAGPVRDLAGEIDDWDEAIRQFFTFLLVAQDQGSGVYSPNATAISLLHQLGGEGILDGRHRPMAAHHAKMAALRGAAGLIAYVGGIDINLDRVNSSLHSDYAPGMFPQHDVQCKVQGPAAHDVVRTFISRWNDHPPALGQPDDGNSKRSTLGCPLLNMFGDSSTVNLSLQDSDDPVGTYLAQIARTFGDCRGLKNLDILDEGTFLDDNGYGFAPDGDCTIESAILGAIKRARRYIYIEDQYLGNLKIATAVADRIRERRAEILDGDPDGFFVYIVVPNFAAKAFDVQKYTRAMLPSASWLATVPPVYVLPKALERMAEHVLPDRVDVGDVWPYLESRWVEILESVDHAHENWELFCLCMPPYQIPVVDPAAVQHSRTPTVDERRIYVHAKVVMVDDIWATIGSANMNVRSYTHDTEINCCFIDGRTDDAGLRVGVRDLRAQLWAEHTGIPAPRWSASDGTTDGATWRSLATDQDPRTRVSTTGPTPVGNRLYLWPKGGADHLFTDRLRTPTHSWSKDGNPIPLPGTGVTELPIYWWLSEPYGKEPWTSDRSHQMPPAIGSDQFAFDGEDGVDYESFDLDPNQ